MIKRILRFATSDGKMFDLGDQAVSHERKLMITQELLSRRHELDLSLDQIDNAARLVYRTRHEIDSIFQQDLLPPLHAGGEIKSSLTTLAEAIGLDSVVLTAESAARRAALRETRDSAFRESPESQTDDPAPDRDLDFTEQLRLYRQKAQRVGHQRDVMNRLAEHPDAIASAVASTVQNVTVGYTGPKAGNAPTSTHDDELDDALDDLEANLAEAFKPGAN